MTDIECGLKKSWHKSGRLWIFAEHMCYYSQMFGSEQKILIKNEAIRDVKVLKAKTAVGSSIDIQTKTDHCRLTSFKSKDGFEKCGRLIRNIVAQYHPNSESNSNINDQSLDAEQQRQHRFKQSFSALNAMSPPLRSHQQQSEPISPLQHGHHRAHSQSIGTSHDKGTGYGKHRSATQGEPLMLQLNNRRKTTASDSSDIGKDSNDEYESSDNIGNNNDNNNNNNGNKSKNKDLRKIKSAIDVDKKHGNVLDEMERGGNNFRPARKGSSSKPNEFLSSGSYGNSSYGTRNNNLVNHSSAGHHLGNQVNNLKILDSFEFQTDHFSSDPNIRKHRGSGSGTGTGGIGGTGNDNQTSNNDDKNKNNNKHNLSINHSINSNSNNVHNNSDSELNPRNKDRHYREARSFGDEVDMERDNDDNDDNDRTKKPEIYHRSSTKLECKDNEQSNEEFDTRRRSRKGAMSPGDENDNDNYSDEYNSQNYSRHRSSSDPGNKNNNNSSNSSIIDQIRVSTKQLLEKLDPKSNADGSKSKLKSKSKSKSKSRSNEKENDKEKGDKSKGSLHLGNSNSTGHIINGTANMKTTGDNTTENTSDCHDSPVVTSNDEDGGSAASKKRKHHKRHHGSHGKKRKKLKKSELEARLNGIPINDGLLGNGMFSKSKNKNTPDKQSSKKVDSGSAASLAIGNDGGGGVNEKHTSNNKNNNNGGEMNGSSNQEKKENDNGNGALSKYIDESYGNAKYVETKGNDKLDFELIGDTIIHATPVKIWQRLFETKDFANEMHKRRKATDVKIFEWIIDTEKNDEKWRKENNQPVTWLRKQEYIIPVKDAPPFMANTAQVYEAQRVRFFGKNRLCIDSRVATPKITYGDCFFLVHKQTFELIGPNQSKVTAYLGFDWVKNTWFKKVIQSKLCVLLHCVTLFYIVCHERALLAIFFSFLFFFMFRCILFVLFFVSEQPPRHALVLMIGLHG